jgi:hypothetical protein
MTKKNHGSTPKERDHNRGQEIGSRGNTVQDVVRTTFRKDTHSLKGEKHGISQRKK